MPKTAGASVPYGTTRSNPMGRSSRCLVDSSKSNARIVRCSDSGTGSSAGRPIDMESRRESIVTFVYRLIQDPARMSEIAGLLMDPGETPPCAF